MNEAENRSIDELRDDERGISLVFSAIALVAVLGGAAIAIDLGMAYTARTEAQRVADASALAGAGWLAVHPGSESGTLAREEALRFATEHEVMNESVDPDEVEINVDTDADTVGVTVYRAQSHNNPLGTLFATVLGFETVDVTAHAVAKAAPTNPMVHCTLPLTLPDLWREPDGELADPNDTWDPDEDTYNPASDGYNISDHYGRPITLKTNTAPGNYNPSWWGPYRRFNTQGAADYRAQIKGCTDESEEPQTIGNEVNSEPGNMTGPTKQGFDDLYDQDPEVYWKESGDNVPKGGCVWDPNKKGGAGCTMNSPRIRPVPFFDPRQAPDPGAADYFELVNFGNVFIEEMNGGQVTVRLIGLNVQTASDGGSNNDLFKHIRLIE